MRIFRGVLARLACGALILPALCGCVPTKADQLAQCKTSGEEWRSRAQMEAHLDNCMAAHGYTFVETKGPGQIPQTEDEKTCLADWDRAHFKPECYAD